MEVSYLSVHPRSVHDCSRKGDLATQLRRRNDNEPLLVSFAGVNYARTAYHLFGYLTINGNKDSPVGEREDWELVRKVLGDGCWQTAGSFAEPLQLTQERIQVFFKYLYSPLPLSALLQMNVIPYDLVDPRSPINDPTTWSLRIRRATFTENSPMYLFRPLSALRPQDADSEIGVFKAATALQIIRCCWGPALEDVARELMLRGIAFQTFVHAPISIIPHVPHSTEVTYRVGYTPTYRDYRVYESKRTHFLHSRRGRAAILAGGIIARLAREIVVPQDVIHGPPTDVMQSGTCFVDQFPLTGCEDIGHWDDRLTQEEEDLMCGVYRVETSKPNRSVHAGTFPSLLVGRTNPKEVVYVSWWPRPSSFSRAGFNVGYWSKDCEKWFQNRLAELRNGRAKTRSVSSWRVNLKLTKVVPRVIERNEERAAEYLSS